MCPAGMRGIFSIKRPDRPHLLVWGVVAVNRQNYEEPVSVRSKVISKIDAHYDRSQKVNVLSLGNAGQA